MDAIFILAPETLPHAVWALLQSCWVWHASETSRAARLEKRLNSRCNHWYRCDCPEAGEWGRAKDRSMKTTCLSQGRLPEEAGDAFWEGNGKRKAGWTFPWTWRKQSVSRRPQPIQTTVTACSIKRGKNKGRSDLPAPRSLTAFASIWWGWGVGFAGAGYSLQECEDWRRTWCLWGKGRWKETARQKEYINNMKKGILMRRQSKWEN